jgi:outer membrane receptor protein involved in Fe transport
MRSGTIGAGQTAITSREGTFTFDGVPVGTYTLRVFSEGFAIDEREITVGSTPQDVTVVLAIGENRVTVSAELGRAEDAANVPQSVNVIGSENMAHRVTTVIAQAAKEEPGLNVQRTSPTIGAIVIRGMTGKNVVNYVDGVRYTHSGQRGGINTFFNLNDSSTFNNIEVLRGPNGAQYGSDSLAGTVNLVSRSPVFGVSKPEFHGEIDPSFSTADRAFGSAAMFSYGTQRFGGYVNMFGRRVGDTRTAGGIDSHSAITRFLGRPSTVLYARNPGTGFEQYGGSMRLNYAPLQDQILIFFYQRSKQDNGKRFDQMLGGDGNLIADLRNLMLDFGYVRYIKQGSVSSTVPHSLDHITASAKSVLTRAARETRSATSPTSTNVRRRTAPASSLINISARETLC